MNKHYYVSFVINTVHYRHSHKYNTKTKENFNEIMFPYRRKTVKKATIKRFADDLASRCAQEVQNAHAQFDGELSQIIPAMKFAKRAMIMCYQGNCSMCMEHSFTCNGMRDTEGYWGRPFLPKDYQHFDMTKDDIAMLSKMIDFRLGEKGLKLTALQTNSQKAESVNRAFNRVNPKDITLSRNFSGSVHTAILDVNNRRANATVMRAEAAGSPITPGSRVAAQLQAEDDWDLKNKERQASESYKRKANNRAHSWYISQPSRL